MFLAFQLLTLPPWIDPCRTPFSQLSHTVLFIVVFIIDPFYIIIINVALVSALEQTHHAHVACDFE